MPAVKSHKIPQELEPGVAAAALLQGLTALTLIREAYLVKKGEWVLVHAAAGGVGLWLCQLLKAVGARTIGTSSNAEKLQLAKDNGAEVVINYKDEAEGFAARVKEITGGEGVSVVFDSTGKAQFENDLEVVKRCGTVVSFGNSVRYFTFLSPDSILLITLVWSRSTVPNCSTLGEEHQAAPTNTLQLHLHSGGIREILR